MTGRIMSSQICPHTNSHMNIKVADGIKSAYQLILRQGVYSVLSRGAQCNHKGQQDWKRGQERKNRERCNYGRRFREMPVAGFETGGRHTAVFNLCNCLCIKQVIIKPRESDKKFFKNHQKRQSQQSCEKKLFFVNTQIYSN